MNSLVDYTHFDIPLCSPPRSTHRLEQMQKIQLWSLVNRDLDMDMYWTAQGASGATAPVAVGDGLLDQTGPSREHLS